MSEYVEDLGAFFEGVTTTVEFTIKDDAGVAFNPDDLYVTLYDEESGTIINSKDGSSDIKGTAMTGSDGVVTFDLAVADCVILNTFTRKLSEVHRLVFKWTWLTEARVGYYLANFIMEPRDA